MAGTAPCETPAGGTAPARVAVPELPAPRPEPDNHLFAVIEQLSREASRLRSLLGGSQRETPPDAWGAPKDALELAGSNGIELLVSQGMCAASARRLVDEALSDGPRPLPGNSLQQRLEVSIARDCRVDSTLGLAAAPSEPAIAAFVGVELSASERAAVVERSSFAYMKKIEHKFEAPGAPWANAKGSMLRKGESGGSAELITAEQQRRIDDHCRAELARLGCDFPYDAAFGTPKGG